MAGPRLVEQGRTGSAPSCPDNQVHHRDDGGSPSKTKPTALWLAEDQLLERSAALKELIMPRMGTGSLPERRARAVQDG